MLYLWMCICVHVCEWCQCGGCSCVLVRLCERGGYVPTWCPWRSEDNLGCQSSPSTLFWDRPSCVLSTAFVKLAGPTKLQKVSCLYFPSPGELQMVMVSMWLPRGFWMSRLRPSCLHDKLVPRKPFPRPHSSPLSISSSLSSSKMLAGAADSPASIMLFRASSCSVSEIRQADGERCQTPYIQWGV